MGMRVLLFCSVLLLPPAAGRADEKLVRLYVPPELVETGLMQHILPRFSLKTQIRVELVDSAGEAELLLGGDGTALFEGAGQVWHLGRQGAGGAAAERFAEWLGSDVGRNTVTGFAPDGVAIFALPGPTETETVAIAPDGDAALGWTVSREKCTRCHAVDDESRMAGIGSTPSFSVLRSLGDWEYRFSTFYALNPHPSFTIIEDVTPPFPENRPPPISPIQLSLEEVEAVLAFVAAMEAADLGAPLHHQ
ncbi:hypothetical protein [Tropicimonas aquimaris]|uniref:Cytochrome c domain-containing protein n=1 Tax=Tropicimonas aquimaris TaxID=914152 RepID=A0ABW3IMH8_9RHOB